jgi:DNA-binding response OmpR family regulator
MDMSMKILVIDDDDQVRELLCMWLAQEGYEVLEADNGRNGVEIQRNTPVDLLVCDLIMPVQEGIETITQFREEFPAVGIIAISGGGKIGPDSYLSVAGYLGAWKVFAKPVDMSILLAAIREWDEKANSTGAA